MLKKFLNSYSEDRVETFNFVLLTIFTWGMYTVYWLGKINKNFKQNTKSPLVSEGMIITLGIFSFIEGLFIYMAVGSGLEGDFETLDMLDTLSYIGVWGYLITSVVIAFHIKNQISLICIKEKINITTNPIYSFNVFFLIIFGLMYVCYKFNAMQIFKKVI